MINWLYPLTSSFLISLVSFIGLFTFSLKKSFLKKIIHLLVAFAAGALFGDAFIHLLPQAFQKSANRLEAPVFVIFGILLFFVLEKFIRWHHCHNLDCKKKEKPVALMNLIADSIHNLIDGMLIAASFLVSFPIGISTSIAIFLHEIPQEIGDFAVLIHGGFSTKKALLFNFFTALSALLGTVLVLITGQYYQNITTILIPITAGGFIYIAGSDLIPELHHQIDFKKSLKQILAIIAGVIIMLLLTMLE